MARFLDSELLRRVRVELGLTQEQAAARLRITERAYRRYESGAVNDPRRGFVVRHANRRRVTDRICSEFGLTEEALLPEREPRAVARVWTPKRVHALPRSSRFVGREALLRELGPWLDAAAPEVRVVALVAVGGAGKTTLLERILETVEGRGPRGLFVWSFYEDGRVDAFIREATAYFAPAGAPASVEPLAEALGAGPAHVLALDGLEAIQSEGRGARARGELEDASLRRLLRSVAAGLGGARVVVTSRFELVDLASWEGSGLRTIRLGDLSGAEAARLLEAWGVAGTKAERSRLAERLGGHALSVAVAGSYAAAFLDGDPARVEGLDLADAAEDDPLARRLAGILEQYARALSPAERDLMARLAAFPQGASLATIRALAAAGGSAAASLASLTEVRLRRLVARLERLGLVTRGRENIIIHPFVRDRFLRRLGVESETLHRVETGRLSEALRGQPDSVGRAIAEDPTYLDRGEALFHAALRAGLPGDAFQIYVRTLGGFPRLGLRAGDMTRGARVLSAFAPGGDPHELDARLPAELRAAAAYDWGLYAGALGDLTLADRCYAAFETFAREAHPSAASLALAARTRAYVARLRGDLVGALALIERSVGLATELRLESHLSRGVALEASIRHELGDVARAGEGFARVRALEGEPEARRALWEAEHHLDLGNLDLARGIAQRVSDLCESLGWEGHVAHAGVVLGLLQLEGSRADTGRARELLERARHWSDRTGEVEVVLRVRDLAARVALAEKSLDRAADEVRRGLELARTCGFRLAEARAGVVAAEVALARGDARTAHTLAEAVIGSGTSPWHVADAAHTAGVALHRLGDDVRARQSLRMAVRERERLGHRHASRSRDALATLTEGDSCPTES
ncbi:MAG TPA: helix-turn-helix domain-containing protein [Planctomycetota bacterium]|nr:helix-turn-helix domain-containing protein [Planctomycetota bacterium]